MRACLRGNRQGRCRSHLTNLRTRHETIISPVSPISHTLYTKYMPAQLPAPWDLHPGLCVGPGERLLRGGPRAHQGTHTLTPRPSTLAILYYFVWMGMCACIYTYIYIYIHGCPPALYFKPPSGRSVVLGVHDTIHPSIYPYTSVSHRPGLRGGRGRCWGGFASRIDDGRRGMCVVMMIVVALKSMGDRGSPGENPRINQGIHQQTSSPLLNRRW